MTKKQHYKTVFISDIHLGNIKNQSNKLIKFLDSIIFENLIIIGDYIDYRQLKGLGKRTKQDKETLNYINNLTNNGIKITYIQGNHDRQLKCGDEIYIENMNICRDLYYKTKEGKTYYVTHGDCIDGINKNGNSIGFLGSIFFSFILKIESFFNKNAYKNSCLSNAEKLDERIKKIRVPKDKLDKKIIKLCKNINCDGIIIGHFHVASHYIINNLDYFNTGDWLRNCSAVLEDLKGKLELIKYNEIIH